MSKKPLDPDTGLLLRGDCLIGYLDPDVPTTLLITNVPDGEPWNSVDGTAPGVCRFAAEWSLGLPGWHLYQGGNGAEHGVMRGATPQQAEDWVRFGWLPPLVH